MTNWKDLVNEVIGPEDQIQKVYYANFERTAGMLVISGKQLLFVEEKGFITKTHNIILEISLNKIREVTVISERQLMVVDVDGKRHTFSTDIPALIVEETLKGLMPVPGASP